MDTAHISASSKQSIFPTIQSKQDQHTNTSYLTPNQSLFHLQSTKAKHLNQEPHPHPPQPTTPHFHPTPKCSTPSSSATSPLPSPPHATPPHPTTTTPPQPPPLPPPYQATVTATPHQQRTMLAGTPASTGSRDWDGRLNVLVWG